VSAAAKKAPAPAPSQAAGWLYKTEPSVYSIADLKKEGRCRWDGVRNYRARNFLREARVGDPVAIWHSNIAQPGVAGLGRIVKAPYPDPTAFDKKHHSYDPKSDPAAPRWVSVDVAFVAELPRVIPASQLKADPTFAGLLFFRQGRLSVCPANAAAWKRLRLLCAQARTQA
jgi:predicted RNA-binding protein with PUA-like domain